MTQLEKEVEERLRQKVEALGGKCLKFVSPGNGGVPDRLVILPTGLIVFVETKRPKGGKYSALQKYWARVLLNLGCFYRTAHTFGDVDRLAEDLRLCLLEGRR